METMESLGDIMKKLNLTALFSEFDQGAFEQLKADSYNKTDGELNQLDGVECPICRNKGNIMKVYKEGGNYYRRCTDCSCMTKRKFIMMLKRSGLENVADEYTFDKYEAQEPWQKAVKKKATDFANNPDGWFFIGGQVGCGKSHICTAICNELISKGMETKYMLWRDEIVPLKAMVNEYEVYQNAVRKYKDVPVLYIDDMFKTGKGADGKRQRPTPADINIAFEILNDRYVSKKITIISSECTFDALMDIDEAVASRIKERARTPLTINPDRKKNYRMRDIIEL